MYKLVGPVLMKQEQEEAKHNVDKRLEWINDEMYVSLSSDSVRFRGGSTRRRLLHRIVQHENGVVSETCFSFESAATVVTDKLTLRSKRAETKLKDVSSKLEEKKGEASLLIRGPYVQRLERILTETHCLFRSSICKGSTNSRCKPQEVPATRRRPRLSRQRRILGPRSSIRRRYWLEPVPPTASAHFVVFLTRFCTTFHRDTEPLPAARSSLSYVRIRRFIGQRAALSQLRCAHLSSITFSSTIDADLSSCSDARQSAAVYSRLSSQYVPPEKTFRLC